MTFEEWKSKFDSVVTPNHIMVDWDSGHAYSHIEGGPSIDDCDDQDSAQEYEQEYLNENEPILYCVPNLINELNGENCVVACDCQCYEQETDEENVEYVEGFVELVKRGIKLNPKEDSHHTEWYKLELLEKWIKEQKAGMV